MLDKNRVDDVIGMTVYDADGNKVGRLGQVYTDDHTGEPSWATIHTGLFGTSESFVPIRDAAFDKDQVTVPYTKDTIREAPTIDVDEHLAPEDEYTLFDHYSLDYTDIAGGYIPDSDHDFDSAVFPSSEDAPGSVLQFQVSPEGHPSSAPRLRKYVVGESVPQPVAGG